MTKRNALPALATAAAFEEGRWSSLQKKGRAWLQNLVFYLVVTLVVTPFALPLVWMVSASLRTPGLPPPLRVEWLPSPAAWGNYAALFEMLPFGRYLFNSFLISTLGAALTIIAASWAGFGMAQLGRRLRARLLALSVGLLMVPVTALWLTRFLLFNAIGWVDSYLATRAR